MCFSATASFLAAGVTGAVGVICLARVRLGRERPIAAIPLLFAAQQAIEGLIWLRLGQTPPEPAGGLTLAFLLFAQVIWPAYAPAAVILAEPDPRRRRLMAPLLLAGALVSAWLLMGLLTHPHHAAIQDHHITYGWGDRPSALVGAAYLAAVGVTPLLSSHRAIAALGAIILVGSVVAFHFYFNAFQSVWCFFAALASVAVLAHVRRPSPTGGAARARA
jgi:hypothetical protein